MIEGNFIVIFIYVFFKNGDIGPVKDSKWHDVETKQFGNVIFTTMK